MLVLSFVSSGLEFWSANHTSIYENSESKAFLRIKFLCEASNNWPNVFLETNVYKLLNLANNCYNCY